MTVVPATFVLSLLESSPREASIGKRTRYQRVVDAVTGSRVSFRRSILRNTPKDRRALDDRARCGVLHCPGKWIRACPCISLVSDGCCLRVADHVRRLPLCRPRTHTLRPHFWHHRHPGSSSGYIVLRRSDCDTSEGDRPPPATDGSACNAVPLADSPPHAVADRSQARCRRSRPLPDDETWSALPLLPATPRYFRPSLNTALAASIGRCRPNWRSDGVAGPTGTRTMLGMAMLGMVRKGDVRRRCGSHGRQAWTVEVGVRATIAN